MNSPLELTVVEALPLFALLFAASFFFSGTETAVFSLQKVDRQRFAEQGGAGGQVLKLLRRRAPLISSILIGNESVNVSIGALGALLVASYQPSRPWLNVLLITPMLLLFSEITPKILAFRFNATWSRAVAWPLTAFHYVVAPVRFLMAALVTLLARPFGVRGGGVADRLEEAELRSLVVQGAASGDVAEREREIIEAVFEFDELSVGRIMTPRPDIFAVPVDLPWQDLLERCRASHLSRVPMYDSRVDQLVGVLLLKDLLKYRDRPPSGPRQLRSILIPPWFVPQSKPADDMLREFMERRAHMAFVVNEHGTLVGLVTLDDLLSELVGEILEPGDDATEADVERLRPGVLEVKGTVDIEDFAEEAGIHLPNGEYRTVGGFVFHLLGRLPKTGDAVTWEGHRYVVSEMDGRRIAAIQVAAAGGNDGGAP